MRQHVMIIIRLGIVVTPTSPLLSSSAAVWEDTSSYMKCISTSPLCVYSASQLYSYAHNIATHSSYHSMQLASLLATSQYNSYSYSYIHQLAHDLQCIKLSNKICHKIITCNILMILKLAKILVNHNFRTLASQLQLVIISVISRYEFCIYRIGGQLAIATCVYLYNSFVVTHTHSQSCIAMQFIIQLSRS